VIRLLLIIQVPDASNQGAVTLTFRPIDRFSLRFEGAEHVVRMVFDDIIVDMAPLRSFLGPHFNVNVRHALSPEVVLRISENFKILIPNTENCFDLAVSFH
jgi:hypothetical protein